MTEPHEGLRSLKKQMTRDLIAEAALKLTLERGLDHVTSDEIAHVAFVSPRTVSNYFSCKEEAVVAAGSPLPEVIEQYAHSPAGDAPPLRALQEVVTQLFASRAHGELEKARQRMQLTEDHPMLLKFQMASYGQAERDLREIIAERTGTQVGIDLYPSLAASAALAAMRTAFWIWAQSPAPDERLAELVEMAFDHFRNGLDPSGATPVAADTNSAAAVVALAVTSARDAQADAAAHAVGVTGEAVAAAAEKTADAAEMARLDRAAAAADAAKAVAGTAARAATATQIQADASATKLSEATARAVAIVRADKSRRGDRDTAETALHLASTAEALAVATAADTAAEAARVATAVTSAASDVALSVSELDKAIEEEVARVATALRTTATAIARQVAADTHARATDVALIARGAAAAAAAALDLKGESSPAEDSAIVTLVDPLPVSAASTLMPIDIEARS